MVIPMQLNYPEQGRFAYAYIDLNKDGLTDFVIETNLWNIERSDGFLKMVSNDETLLSVEIKLKNVVQIDPHRWVHAYPEIWYGAKPWNKLGPTDDSWIKLPERLEKMHDFSTTVDYSIMFEDAKLPYNFALETWLTRNLNRKGVSTNEVEIMVWLSHRNLNPAGIKVAEMKLPVILNGIETTLLFSLFRADMNWEYFAFIVKEPVEKGGITFRWSFFLKKAMEFSKIGDWPDLYFTVIETGTEFGSPGYSNVQLAWVLKKLKLEPLNKPILDE